MFIETKNILEMPSRYVDSRYRDSSSPEKDAISLEERIKSRFGESGLARFKEYDITLDLPSPQFEGTTLNIYHGGQFLDAAHRGKCIGEIYHITAGIDKLIERVTAQKVDAQVYASREGSSNRKDVGLALTLNLNPEDENCQYLRLLFSF